jgi:glycerophosphoryl diester phosphodiesterase
MITFPRVAVCVLALCLPVAAGASASADGGGGAASAKVKKKKAKPAALVIGHRGAAGYRPEHTLAGYTLAAEQGANYIEPDLVSTKDGVLVDRHEPEISTTTNVADKPQFAARKRTKTVDGVSLTGWFTEDFTLAELRTLRAKERIPAIRPQNVKYDGRYQVPTFQEVIDLSKRLTKRLKRPIGIYPETKHPTYFKGLGLALEPKLVKILKRNKLDGRKAKVFVQSFETAGLRQLNRQIDVPLVALLGGPDEKPGDNLGTTYGKLSTAKGLKGLAKFADGVGPSKDAIFPLDANGRSKPATSFVRDAHKAGLLVHPYTFRRENVFLPLELRSSADPNQPGNLVGEITKYLKAGVDGFFTDNPDLGRKAVRAR